MRTTGPRTVYKKMTFEDKFARDFYCNSHRFVSDMKRRNRKEFRRKLKQDTEKQAEKYTY